MKVRTYIRVGKGGKHGYKIDASTKPNYEPMSNKQSWSLQFYPTVWFALDIDVPEALFEQASTVIGQINVGLKEATVSNQIVLPKDIKVIK